MSDTATLNLFATPRRFVPGKVYRYGPVSVIHCHKDPKQPHGVGHNSVCVCQCADCARERGEA